MSVTDIELRDEGVNFARFCVVGGGGFVIDAGLLLLFTLAFAMDPFAARALSILLAICATWMAHRVWTFRSNDPGKLAEWSRFAAVNGAGGAINYGVYSAILLALPGTALLLALGAGSAVALIANYLGSRLWAFRR